MSVHKVKANSAEIKGDFVHVTKNSLKSLWFIIGCINGFFTAFVIKNLFELEQYGTDITTAYYAIVILLSGVVFILSSGKKIEYQIPKSDLLAIKRYPLDRRVTVVFDDQKMKGAFLAFE